MFVALAVPESVKSAIEKAQAELRRVLPEKAARWTKREQFHLTLRFLGNVPVSRVDDLVNACREACHPHPPLRLIAQKVGFFPNNRMPRVVWVGIRDLDERLLTVWASIQAAVTPFTSEPPEREFTGHVTLARLNRIGRPEAAALARTAAAFEKTGFGEWTAEQLELMRSELSPEGAHHSVVAELRLMGSI